MILQSIAKTTINGKVYRNVFESGNDIFISKYHLDIYMLYPLYSLI